MVCVCLGACICAAAATASTMISYYFYDKINKEQQQHCNGCNTEILKATVDPEWGRRRPTELRRHAQHVYGGLDEKISDNKFDSITTVIATVISSEEDQEIIDIFYHPEKEMKI